MAESDPEEVTMDDARFDAWTRRRFGLAMGGGVAALIGLSIPNDIEARKKKRCKTLKQGCQPGNKKKKCCTKQGLSCAKKFGLGAPYCCKQIQATCTDISECCSDLDCAPVTGLAGDRCCKSVQSQCRVKTDCCGDLTCVAGKCA